MDIDTDDYFWERGHDELMEEQMIKDLIAQSVLDINTYKDNYEKEKFKFFKKHFTKLNKNIGKGIGNEI
jgi:hypothetical protein